MNADRKQAEEILQKHFRLEWGRDGSGEFMKYILDAMEEYANLHRIEITEGKIKTLENEYYYSERALDEKCTWRHGFDDALSMMREKLTGTKSEDQQKGAPFNEEKTMM